MKYITFFWCAFSLLIFDEQCSQGQNWLWGKQGSSSLNSGTYYSPIATDKYGNAYVTGTFDNTAVFGPHTLNGNAVNAYLAKFNSVGKLVWVQQAIDSSSAYTISESVTTDNSGNVFIAGNISGYASFGKYSIGTPYGYCAFLVKYDPGGNVLWARQSGIVSNNAVYNCAVATDNQGNIFVTGLFDTTTSFGARVLTNISGTSSNVFLVKYNSTGNVQWARQSTGTGLDNNYNYPFSIATDMSGDVYVTSDFGNSVTFGSYTLQSTRYYSVYLVKYSSQGALLWARQSINNTNFNITGSMHSLGYGYSVVADQAGNAYITGTFQDSVTFGSKTLSSPYGYSVFFTKYDVNGNVVWAQQSSQGWAGTGLAADEYNHIYISGQIIYYYLNSGALDFGGLKLDAPDNNTASFIIKFNTDGTPYCGSILNNVGESGENTGVASDLTGSYIYMGAIFYGREVICGPDTLVSQGAGTNLLLARWSPCDSSQLVTPPSPPPVVQSESEPCDIFVPTAFSPNQAVNNMLYVRSSCIASMNFFVFDRWANKVFESNNQNFGWDGTYAGQPMNTGTYIWYLKATLSDGSNVEKKGNITLVR